MTNVVGEYVTAGPGSPKDDIGSCCSADVVSVVGTSLVIEDDVDEVLV